MRFLLAFFSLTIAESIVELERVSASATNVYGCNKWNNSQADCAQSPYCYWRGTAANNGKCVDDPCLSYAATCEPGGIGITVDGTDVTVQCAVRTLTGVNNSLDCQANVGNASICAQAAIDKSSLMDYCVYSQLKDGTCPQSICREANLIGAANERLDKHCVKTNTVGPCTLLSKSDCALIPKCWWNNSGDGSCHDDFCFQPRLTNVPCAGVTGNTRNPTAYIAGKCVDFHPVDPVSGEVLDYCIYTDNSKANICYFGTAGASLVVTDDDYGNGGVTGTYPTYNISGTERPSCATNALPNCEGKGKCVTIVNPKGAFAGRYCTDGTHAGDGSLIPRASLLVAILLVLGSLLAS